MKIQAILSSRNHPERGNVAVLRNTPYVSCHGSMTRDELMRDDPAEQERQVQQMGRMD